MATGARRSAPHIELDDPEGRLYGAMIAILAGELDNAGLAILPRDLAASTVQSGPNQGSDDSRRLMGGHRSGATRSLVALGCS
jgi:hypothetical protein